MKRKKWSMMVACLSFAAAPASYAADSCVAPCLKPPANTRHVSIIGNYTFPAFPAPILTAALAKGKAKRVIVVEATVTAYVGPSPLYVGMLAYVNGIPMESPGAGADCPGLNSCTLSGTFWLDIDANPGLIGAPLTVTLSAQDGYGVGGQYFLASMTVRQEKK